MHAEATNAAIKLTSQDKVSAIIGAATSGDTVAQAQIANRQQNTNNHSFRYKPNSNSC